MRVKFNDRLFICIRPVGNSRSCFFACERTNEIQGYREPEDSTEVFLPTFIISNEHPAIGVSVPQIYY